MFTQDKPRCFRSFIEPYMQRKVFVSIRDRTDDSKSSFGVKERITDNYRWAASSLFMSRLGVKIDSYYIALLYHISPPTGSPQSISSGA